MPKTSTRLSRTEIAMRVRGIIEAQIGEGPLQFQESVRLRNLDLDDLDVIEMLMTIEESFDILTPVELDGETTVGALIDLVEGQVRAEESKGRIS